MVSAVAWHADARVLSSMRPGPCIQGDEAGVDCGGVLCRACTPTCFDGLQNGGESGVDCGGSCAFCIPACTVPNSPDQARPYSFRGGSLPRHDFFSVAV